MDMSAENWVEPKEETGFFAKLASGLSGFQEFDATQSDVQNTPTPLLTNLEQGFNRIKESVSKTFEPQEDCSWWNVPCKISHGFSFVQSTLVKIIILVVIVAISYIFLMSYISAKAGRLANA
jgi:hypothetical protein